MQEEAQKFAITLISEIADDCVYFNKSREGSESPNLLTISHSRDMETNDANLSIYYKVESKATGNAIQSTFEVRLEGNENIVILEEAATAMVRVFIRPTYRIQQETTGNSIVIEGNVMSKWRTNECK